MSEEQARTPYYFVVAEVTKAPYLVHSFHATAEAAVTAECDLEGDWDIYIVDGEIPADTASATYAVEDAGGAAGVRLSPSRWAELGVVTLMKRWGVQS